MAALPCCATEDVEAGAQPCVSTGRSIHAVPSITPSPREGIEDGPRLRAVKPRFARRRLRFELQSAESPGISPRIGLKRPRRDRLRSSTRKAPKPPARLVGPPSGAHPASVQCCCGGVMVVVSMSCHRHDVHLPPRTGQSTSDEHRTALASAPSNLLHSSGTPALRRPPKMGPSWVRYVGSSLIADQRVRPRETVKPGLSARPALTAERASAV